VYLCLAILGLGSWLVEMISKGMVNSGFGMALGLAVRIYWFILCMALFV
jgi:hypothetical protein